MLKRTYDGQDCSIARALEVVGERWTLLIVRDALLGLRRFDEFQRNLGIARKVLADRLRWLVDEGILERVPYQERPKRYEYHLTERAATFMSRSSACGNGATITAARSRRCSRAQRATRSP